MAEDTVKFLLAERDIPTQWVNLLVDLPGEPLPPLSRATMEPAGPPDLTPIFPMGLIEQEVSAEPRVDIPRGGARRLPAVATHAAVPGAAPRARARHARAHLLQVRGRLARRLAQAEHRGAAGVRERAGGHEAPEHGDRRGAVGLGARVRLRALRPGVRGVHGRLLLRPEALPPLDDARRGAPRCTARPARSPRPGAASRRTRRDRSASRSPRRSRWRPRARTPTTRLGRCSTTCCSTRP